MKTMTCKQLGGPCELELQADTFEEMVEKSKAHGMEMYQKGDPLHVSAMNQMKEKMQTQSPEEMKAWFESKRKEFDALPSNAS